MSVDLASELMDWEDGKDTDEQEDSLFQHLIDTGLAWTLQGMYGRRAMDLLTEGRIHRRDTLSIDTSSAQTDQNVA